MRFIKDEHDRQQTCYGLKNIISNEDFSSPMFSQVILIEGFSDRLRANQNRIKEENLAREFCGLDRIDRQTKNNGSDTVISEDFPC